MFEAKDVIGEAVERAVSRIGRRKRGDTVTWEDVEDAAGFDRDSPHWTQFLKRVRRDILKGPGGIKLAAVPGVGLKLMTVSEQVNDLSRQRRARRQLNRGIGELKAVPDRELSDHERQAKHRKIDLARTARRGADYALRVGRQLMKPSSSGVPRVRQPAAT